MPADPTCSALASATSGTSACTASRRAVLLGAATLLAGLLPRSRTALAGEVYTGFLSSTAVGGYDPVAYFREGKPVSGSSSITTEWKGVTWRFASEANRTAFLAEPERYAPAYGGHCAWATAQGYKAKGDPQHWKIVEGRLYLNYDARVQADWEKDIPGFIRKADTNWPSVKDK